MTNLEAIEAELLRCAEVARSKGLDIVYGAWRETGVNNKTCGVCVMEAYYRSPEWDKMFHIYAHEEDAIVAGFDDNERSDYMPVRFYDLGARLRTKLNPRPSRV